MAKVSLDTELKVWKVGTRRNVPWEIDETWCCCACRRLLCVPLGMQFTALPIQSASSTLATVLPGMLWKTLDCCRGRLQVIPDPKWISPGTRIFRFQGGVTLCRAPTFSTEWTPPQPASLVCRLAGSGSDLSVAYVSWMEGGPKLEKQTSLPHVACFTRGEENGAKQSHLRIFWGKASPGL